MTKSLSGWNFYGYFICFRLLRSAYRGQVLLLSMLDLVQDLDFHSDSEATLCNRTESEVAKSRRKG